MALTECGDEYIVVSVVVIVADCDAQSEHRNSESGFLGHVGECAIVVVVIELGSRLRAGTSGPTFAVNEQNVWPPVIVIIDESASGPHGLRQIFFTESAIIVGEMNSRLRGNVAEGDLLGG